VGIVLLGVEAGDPGILVEADLDRPVVDTLAVDSALPVAFGVASSPSRVGRGDGSALVAGLSCLT